MKSFLFAVCLFGTAFTQNANGQSPVIDRNAFFKDTSLLNVTLVLNIKWEDTIGKKKTISEYGFLLEDLKDVAVRNNCSEWKRNKLNTEQTDRRQMTMVAIFEYMIGNTDWAVTVDHNTRLILSRDDTSSKPYVVPYDFDYSGLVNTYYSIPDHKL